jgi:hypothetical protein
MSEISIEDSFGLIEDFTLALISSAESSAQGASLRDRWAVALAKKTAVVLNDTLTYTFAADVVTTAERIVYYTPNSRDLTLGSAFSSQTVSRICQTLSSLSTASPAVPFSQDVAVRVISLASALVNLVPACPYSSIVSGVTSSITNPNGPIYVTDQNNTLTIVPISTNGGGTNVTITTPNGDVIVTIPNVGTNGTVTIITTVGNGGGTVVTIIVTDVNKTDVVIPGDIIIIIPTSDDLPFTNTTSGGPPPPPPPPLPAAALEGCYQGQQTGRVCYFFNTTSNAWETSGVVTGAFNASSGLQECVVEHLTDFAVLESTHDGYDSVCVEELSLFQKYHALFYFFAVVYLIAAAYFVARLMVNSFVYLSHNLPFPLVWYSHGFLSIFLAVRTIFLFVAAELRIYVISRVSLALLLTIPTIALTMGFVLIAAKWAEMVTSRQGAKGKDLLFSSTKSKVFVSSIFIFLVAVSAAVIASSVDSDDSFARRTILAASVFVAGVDVFLAVAFPLFGFFIWRSLRFGEKQTGEKPQSSSRKIASKTILRMICCFCLSFLIQSCLWIYSVLDTQSYFQSFALVYAVFLLMELASVLFLFLATRSMPRGKDGSDLRLCGKGSDAKTDAMSLHSQSSSRSFSEKSATELVVFARK